MKIDRLLGITIYLLNHEKATAAFLGEKYEVSVRTIQRDINTLCMAGIPVVSMVGVEGGYSILDTFKMERQLAKQDDYTFIITALKGFLSAYENPKLEETLGKMKAVARPNSQETNMILDFSILKEKQHINELIKILEQAILDNKAVAFTYTNANNKVGEHEIEPVAIIYKWYNWYLLGYEPAKEDYRFYKLVRMEKLYIPGYAQTKKHPSVEAILQSKERSDTRKYINIKLKCNASSKMKVLEYMNGKIEEALEDETCIISVCVPEEEHFWFATLLALGDEVQIIEPIELRERLKNKCLEILKLYKEL